MFTVDTVLESLQKFDIDEDTLRQWEGELGLNIPTDEFGRRQYSPHHINLFKNIRKNLALGRTLQEIREIVSLPPENASRPAPISRVTRPYAQMPARSARGAQAMSSERSTQVVQMLDRLMAEKDSLQGKLVETEKLNSHLYNANSMFHRKVKELSGMIGSLKEQLDENRHFKLLDEKSRLHAQLIESEKNAHLMQRDLERVQQDLAVARTQTQETEAILNTRVEELKQQLEAATRRFDPKRFCGDWEEQASLMQVDYDNFGINVEPSRNRVFRLSEAPELTFGNTAVITTQYEYEANPLWKRVETIALCYVEDARLEGILTAEYMIDGVPVAKASYRVQCARVRTPRI
ncbi:MAG: MerR family transcriptional regulator [Vampirovibrionales bacterium]|nr:MerR family transcriptional regulator [Vampirovibrionales bacterium]